MSYQRLPWHLASGSALRCVSCMSTLFFISSCSQVISYSEVHEVDSDGKLREVIVIEDTPPPPTISPATTYNNHYSASYQPPVYSAPIRTRARAAAEAAASSSSIVTQPPPAKKRKRDPADEPRTVPTKKAAHQPQPLAATKSWASGSGAATDEVCPPGSLLLLRINEFLHHRHPRGQCHAMIRKGII